MNILTNLFKNRDGKIFISVAIIFMTIVTWFMQGLWFEIMSISSEALLYSLTTLFWLEVLASVILLSLAISQIEGLRVTCLLFVYLTAVVVIGALYPSIPYWIVIFILSLLTLHVVIYFIFKWLFGLYFNIKHHAIY